MKFDVSRTARTSRSLTNVLRPTDAVNLVPRSHTPQVAFPGFAEPRSAPSVETAIANGRPEGLQRNAADLPSVICGKRWPLASNPHLPSFAREQRAKARPRVLHTGPRAEARADQAQSLPERVHPDRQAHRTPGPGKASLHSPVQPIKCQRRRTSRRPRSPSQCTVNPRDTQCIHEGLLTLERFHALKLHPP